MLKNSLYSFVLCLLFSLPVWAESNYKPPEMFGKSSSSGSSPVSPPVSEVVAKEKAVKPLVSDVEVFKPSRKPAHKPKKVIQAQASSGKDLGVSKVVVKARPAGAPSVEAQSLMPPSSGKTPRMDDADRSVIETSIAFLPFAVDLTKRQKDKFKEVLRTYFIERDAREIVVRVYASAVEGDQKTSAKRKALSRALSIRDFLLDLGISSDKITLKAIGEAHDKGLPDRADIEILF